MYNDDPIQTQQQAACFDPNMMAEPAADHDEEEDNNGFSMELDSHLQTPNSWIPTNVSEMGFTHFDENHHTTTDLLTLLHLPRCSFASPSISFGKSSSPSSSSMGFLGVGDHLNQAPGFAMGDHMNDPLFTTQPSPSLREFMLQPLPQGYSSSMFGMPGFDYNGEENMNITGIFQGHHHSHIHGGNGIFEFNSGNPCLSEGKDGKCPKNFVTERQRRQNFKDKYDDLKSLVPNPTKGDRASIVKDAIDYIMELKRTVSELKLLVEKKRMTKERLKRVKSNDEKCCINGGENDNVEGMDDPGVLKPDPDEGFGGFGATQLRSSWLQRKCKDTEVDVRIVDDEVTIKLVQRKKINCLLSVSRSLDELQLDLRHVAGGHVGDYYSYLFNSKICEGSSVYASAIANKLIEVVERQYGSASVTLQPTTSF